MLGAASQGPALAGAGQPAVAGQPAAAAPPRNSSNSKLLPFETDLTQSGDYCTKQCVDFILFRPDKAGRVRATPAVVEKFRSTSQQYKCLSDHYGVRTSIFVQNCNSQ